MKRFLKRCILTLIAGLALCLLPLVLIVLNPSFLYANQTQVGQLTIYHQGELDPAVFPILDQSMQIVQQSSLNDASVEIDFCMVEDSYYPRLINRILGPARAISFLDKVVIMQPVNYKGNYSLFNQHRWKLDQLFAHELVHCYQVVHFGIPAVGKILWKREGHAEYVSRQDVSRNDLKLRIQDYLDIKNQDSSATWMEYEGGMGAVVSYHHYMIVIQYLMEVKGWSMEEILADAQSLDVLSEEMLDWYAAEIK